MCKSCSWTFPFLSPVSAAVVAVASVAAVLVVAAAVVGATVAGRARRQWWWWQWLAAVVAMALAEVETVAVAQVAALTTEIAYPGINIAPGLY